MILGFVMKSSTFELVPFKGALKGSGSTQTQNFDNNAKRLNFKCRKATIYLSI